MKTQTHLLQLLLAALFSWSVAPESAHAQKDPKEAFRIFREAAEQGDADAQFQLGGVYAKGRGVDRSDIEASKWFRKAASQGHTEAQFTLGGLHTKGRGVSKDDTAALRWLTKAANKGHTRALFIVGALHAKGRGAERNLVQAHKFFSLAEKNGVKDASRNRELAASKMTPDQVEEAQRLAREWVPKNNSSSN